MSALQHAFWDEACARSLTDASLLAAMARFEAALARASVHAGIVPEATRADPAAISAFGHAKKIIGP